ncbi:hypothetical protein [Dyadobacter fanqingshengii]|uniref:hypothetical protein n=1 Tax=Dyadobacter fanqingshengii TaxID=2906443 RepID=UPI0020C19006|nr:hypothetical protein [Dyadobacter fanqingshengii]UTM21864.1 hypothetical protein NFI81_26275 [Dyadobacter fanqingshengii]
MNKNEYQVRFVVEDDTFYIIPSIDGEDFNEIPYALEDIDAILVNTDGISELVSELATKSWQSSKGIYDLARKIDELRPGHSINWENTFDYIVDQEFFGTRLDPSKI